MLYYYITVLPKKQAFFRIFFNPLKNGLFPPRDLWKNTAVHERRRLRDRNRRPACSDYCCSGAPTGHVSAQAPHSRHASASISYLPSPSEIAPTGHASAHAPHWMQASLIPYAITVTSCKNDCGFAFPESGPLPSNPIVTYFGKKSSTFSKIFFLHFRSVKTCSDYTAAGAYNKLFFEKTVRSGDFCTVPAQTGIRNISIRIAR